VILHYEEHANQLSEGYTNTPVILKWVSQGLALFDNCVIS